MKTLGSLTASLLLFLLLFTTYSCVSVNYLRTDRAAPSEIAGTYTLLLHGGRYSGDVENVAILDKEGDRYSFEIFAPQYDYTLREQVPAKDAVEVAEKHVRAHHSFYQSRLSRILDPQGNVIGYELRPLYHIIEFGYPDILYIDYEVRDEKVFVKIRLKYELEGRDPWLRGRDSK